MITRWMPASLEETHGGIREISLYSKLMNKRKVFLNGEINGNTANQLLVQLMYLKEESDEPINLYINSVGGEVNSGLVIYDMIQTINTPVNMYCTGTAASMAALIFAGGQKGRRFILPHSQTMIHEPLLSGGVGGSATSIQKISDSILETRELVNRILAEHTGKTIREINKATAFDNYMNAKESVKFGLCDAIVTSLTEEEKA